MRRSGTRTGGNPPGASRPLRVALMVEDFPVISETFVINMAAGLVAAGHDVTILAVSGEKPAPADMHRDVARWGLDGRTRRPFAGSTLIGRFAPDVEGEEPSSWGIARRIAAFVAQAVTLVRQPRFDVVHCQFAHLGLTARRHRRAHTLRCDRLVVHVRGQDVTSFVRTHGEDVYRTLFAEADLVIANSRHFRDRAVQLGAPVGSTIVIGSAVDCSAFAPSPAGPDPVGSDGVEPDTDGADTAGADRGTSDGTRVAMIAVGRLVPKKGLDTAIRAMAELRSSLPGATLEIVGEGPMRNRLEGLVDELDLRGVVTLHGARPHDVVIERFAACDLLLAPSVTPSSGDQDAPVNSLKEAMAMGLPVIGTRHGGIPELVEPGTNGYLVDEGDPVDLAEAIRTAVAERGRWPEMGAAGRERILREYDLPVVTDRLIRAYRALFPTCDPRHTPPTTDRGVRP